MLTLKPIRPDSDIQYDYNSVRVVKIVGDFTSKVFRLVEKGNEMTSYGGQEIDSFEIPVEKMPITLSILLDGKEEFVFNVHKKSKHIIEVSYLTGIPLWLKKCYDSSGTAYVLVLILHFIYGIYLFPKHFYRRITNTRFVIY